LPLRCYLLVRASGSRCWRYCRYRSERSQLLTLLPTGLHVRLCRTFVPRLRYLRFLLHVRCHVPMPRSATPDWITHHVLTLFALRSDVVLRSRTFYPVPRLAEPRCTFYCVTLPFVLVAFVHVAPHTTLRYEPDRRYVLATSGSRSHHPLHTHLLRCVWFTERRGGGRGALPTFSDLLLLPHYITLRSHA